MQAACWCGGRAYEEVLRGTWNPGGVKQPLLFAIVRCSSCGLDRTDPIPDDDSLYERGESVWAEGNTDDVWIERLARELVDRAPGHRILDVGCNAGNLVAAPANHGSRAEGIDLDPVAIECGRAQGRQAASAMNRGDQVEALFTKPA